MDLTQPKQLLVVEDDATLAKLLTAQLNLVGYEVHCEARGAAALASVAEHAPDLVILDLRLPDMSGYEVCRELRRLHTPWELPVLMLTGMARPVDQLRGFAFGGDAYLTKPYDVRELLRTIAALLEETALT